MLRTHLVASILLVLAAACGGTSSDAAAELASPADEAAAEAAAEEVAAEAAAAEEAGSAAEEAGSAAEEAGSAAEEAGSAAEEAAPAAGSNEIAVITVKSFGEIRLRFYPDLAPGHVDNFKKLARDGFYDGVTFHRIIPGFMIQGGDPLTKDDNPGNDGTGGPGWNVKAEFSGTPHRRGIVSMARAGHPDSAGSQFFIVVKDSNFLDGKYTVFGEVTAGMDVADKIVAQKRDRQDRPVENIVIESIRIVGPAEAS